MPFVIDITPTAETVEGVPVRRLYPGGTGAGGGTPGPPGPPGPPGVVTGGLYPYDLIAFFPAQPIDNEVLWSFIADRELHFPNQLDGSMAGAEIAATAFTALVFMRNGIQVGEIDFEAGATVGAFKYFSSFVLAAGDSFELVAPAAADATLAGIKVTLCGSRPSAGESGTVGGSVGPQGDRGDVGPPGTGVTLDGTADGAVALGAAVYSTAGGYATGDCTDTTKARVVGVTTASAAGGAALHLRPAGLVTGILSGATAGAPYYLGSTGLPVLYASVPAGARIIQLGIAANATDLVVLILDLGRRA